MLLFMQINPLFADVANGGMLNNLICLI